jgi:hypothetical protein
MMGCESAPTDPEIASQADQNAVSASISRQNAAPQSSTELNPTLDSVPVFAKPLLTGPIQAIEVRAANSGSITVRSANSLQAVKFIVSTDTHLEDSFGKGLTLFEFKVGEVVDAFGAPPVKGVTKATVIRKR